MYYFTNRILFNGLQLQRSVYVLFILLVSITAAAQPPAANNLFQSTDDALPEVQQVQESNPLKAYPAAQYVVHGVIVMADNAVAVVYSPRNTWHRLNVQSRLGTEDAVVHKISTQGVQIEKQGTLLWLPVLQ